jgi:peptidyl-prolyl cis-trans isomerase D
VPEKRRVRYVLIDTEVIRTSTVVPEADIERFYNDNFQQFSTPDEIRASHILLRTEGKDEAAVRALAENLLKEARGGADFAQLATKYSEDTGSAPRGGDLDFFRRGQMVPAFEEAAFALEAGGISEIVRSDFGFHIIKLTDRRAGETTSLDEVRPQIIDQLSEQRAQVEASDRAERLAVAATDPAALESAAAASGLTVQETEFFALDEPVTGIGPAPALAARVFAMNDQEMSGVVPTPRGPVVATLNGRQEAYIPKIDEVREQVRAAVVTRKAAEVARQRAAILVPRLRSAANFDAAAKGSGLTVETTEPITRDGAVGQLGSAPGVLKAAFAMAVGAVSDPIDTDAGPVIVKVLEKQEATPEQVASNRAAFREELLAERRNRLFAAYMTKAKERMQIRVYYETLQRLVG